MLPQKAPASEAMEGYLDEEARAVGHKSRLVTRKCKTSNKTFRNISGRFLDGGEGDGEGLNCCTSKTSRILII